MSANLPEQGLSVWTGTYDVVNVAEPSLNAELGELLGVGAAPIRINKMDNGVDYMVDQLRQRVSRGGSIDLLRIHGHGCPGVQTISMGLDLWADELPYYRSAISCYNFEHIRPCLAKLQGLFAPNGQVWLMGCKVGADYEGLFLVNKLAKLWRVTVTAGIPDQAGAGGTTTFGLEGETVTAFP